MNKLFASVCGSQEFLQIRIRKQTHLQCAHLCDALPPTWPGQLNAWTITYCPNSANCPLNWIADTVGGLSRYEHTLPPRAMSAVTFSETRCMRCYMAHVVGWTLSFQLASTPWIECSVESFFTAHATLCNMIRSPWDETWTRCRGVEIQSSVMDSEERLHSLNSQENFRMDRIADKVKRVANFLGLYVRKMGYSYFLGVKV